MSSTKDSRAYFDIDPHIAGGTYDASGASIVAMDDYPRYEIAEGVVFCSVFAQNLSLNFVTFPAHSGFPTHTHPEEQISIIREGEIEITIGEVTKMARPGDVIIFPPDVPHAGRTFEGLCRVIDIFSPPRYGMRQLLADADPVRSANVDRWWRTSK